MAANSCRLAGLGAQTSFLMPLASSMSTCPVCITLPWGMPSCEGQ